MIVLDASAATDALLQLGQRGEWATEQIADARLVHAPHLIDTELASTLRRLTLAGELPAGRAAAALDDLSSLRLRRYPAVRLLGRIWALRQVMTAYDATYVALAEVLELPLVTSDARLARTQGHRAEVLVYAD